MTTTIAQLEHLDPTTLDADDNVRLDVRLDAEFLASITEHGVLIPITAVRLPDGTLAVRDGQRRTHAARQVGLATIPVVIRPADGDDTTQRTQRIVEQMVANDHRAPLTDAERANGIHQLLLDGVSASKIAKTLSTTKDAVAAARRAVASAPTMTALDNGQITLLEAASFAEFDGDDIAQAALLQAAGSDQFEHRVAQLRTRAADRARYAAAAESYAARGYTIIDPDRKPNYADTTHIPTGSLKDAAGNPLTDEQIADLDPRHWAIWLDDDTAFIDAETGEPVDEHDIDFDTEDDPDADAAEGLRHFNSVIETTAHRPVYYCLDPAGAGVTMPDWLARRHGLDPAAFSTAGPQDSEEAERARAADAERQRAERRQLIALNKLGDAAQTVRRQWVTELLQRKTAPKGTAIFLTTAIATNPWLLDDHHGKTLAPQLLGLPDTATITDAVTELPATADSRAVVILLGMVLAAMEARTGKDAWRGPSTITKNYLRFLEDNGYPCSDIEHVILGKRKAAALYRHLTNT